MSVLCTVAGVVLAMELLARIDDAFTWSAPMGENYSSAVLREASDGHIRCKPGANFKQWTIEDYSSISRGNTTQGTPRNRDILLLGASELFGLFETPGNDVPSLIENRLASESSCTFRVLNASCPGISLATMNHWLDREYQEWDPAALVVYPSPHLYLDSAWLPGTYVSGLGGREKFESRIGGKIKDRLKTFLPSALQTTLRVLRVKLARWRHPESWVWSELPKARVALFEKHMGEFALIAERGRHTTTIVSHANRFGPRLGEVLDPSREMQWSSLYPRANLQILQEMDIVSARLMRQVAERHGLEFLDLNDRLPAEREFFADAVHFTDKGADAVANIIVDNVVHAQWPSCFSSNPGEL